MTLDEMKRRKIELGLSNEAIADLSGVPLGTVRKIFGGVTKAPRKGTVDALVEVLEKSSHRYDLSRYADSVVEVREGAVAYSFDRQGTYTLDDYYFYSEDRRMELIDGVLYDMTGPSVRHQMIIAEMHRLLLSCPKIREGACTVFMSPCDVQLDKDNRTMLQPDLFIICGEVDLDAPHICGAPDLTVEVLSPSTLSRDLILKLRKYQKAGVKEYWIIDPEYRVVMVYDLSQEPAVMESYDFDSVIPIRLSGGSCKIDFSEINKRVFR